MGTPAVEEKNSEPVAVSGGGCACPLDRETLVQAASALLSHRVERLKGCSGGDVREKGERSADEDADEDIVSVVISFKTPPKQAVLKPRMIPLVHPLFKSGYDDVCLFVKDPEQTAKDRLSDAGVTCVTDVMGVSNLEKQYGTHEAKRELVQMYDLFLVDDRVTRMMPRLLGNAFIRRKKMPLVVRMDRNIQALIDKALSSTSFAPSSGTTCSIRVARASFSEKEIADNIAIAMQGVASITCGGWSAFQSLSIKTLFSPSLPIFASAPVAKDFEATPEEKKGTAVSERKKRSIKHAKGVNTKTSTEARVPRPAKVAGKSASKRSVRRDKLAARRNALLAAAGVVNFSSKHVSDESDDSDSVAEAIIQSLEAGEANIETTFDDGCEADNESEMKVAESVGRKNGAKGNGSLRERPGGVELSSVPQKRRKADKRKSTSERPFVRTERTPGSAARKSGRKRART